MAAKTPRALEVTPTIIALRNPLAESQIKFEQRAHALYYDQQGVSIGDVPVDAGEFDSPSYEPEQQQ